MFFKKIIIFYSVELTLFIVKKMIKNILQKCFCINFSNIIKLVIVVFILWEYFYYCIILVIKKKNDYYTIYSMKIFLLLY